MKRWTACVAALVAALALPELAHADQITPPNVPVGIQVPAGHVAFLKGHAAGTQNYLCLPSGSGVAWTLFGPQATLFNDDFKQSATHFLSANPFEAGTPRPTWQSSFDTSVVWGRALASSIDPPFVSAGAIPWLLVQVVGAQDGPTGGHKLTRTTFIQRVNTVAGSMPSAGCAVSTDIGKRALMPYETDYYFYRDANDGDDSN
jgi:Protein of unknown function (DUF3455)